MRRSKWKGYFIENTIRKWIKKLIRFNKLNQKQKERLLKRPLVKKIQSRSSTILPIFVGQTVSIHNGRNFYKYLIKENMVGHKFGELAYSRARYEYKKNKKK